MKKLLLLMGLTIPFLFHSSSSFSSSFFSVSFQEKTVAEKSAYLQKLHKEIFMLPYDRTFITDKIMAEVTQKRNEVAPHYPSRNQTGDDAQKVNEAFEKWISTYPIEYNSYIDQVSIILRKYKSASR